MEYLKTLCAIWLWASASVVAGADTGEPAADADDDGASILTMIVMDPLAAPLSCPCVEGYAQRKYEVLADRLKKHTGRGVKLVFSEALETALKGDAKGRADLIIGKDSVVRSDAKRARLQLTAVGRLTGKDGATTQTGLIVVAKGDAAKSVKDLAGYRIIFGPAECDEKHAAALDLLLAAGVPTPKKLEVNQACSDGAAKVVELASREKIAAVISSYAAPLLEGCGTIQKGDLRVVGETKPVPFVTAFTTDSVDEGLRTQIQNCLLASVEQPDVLIALESLIGFTPPEAADRMASKKK